jgi:hypothetical protein
MEMGCKPDSVHAFAQGFGGYDHLSYELLRSNPLCLLPVTPCATWQTERDYLELHQVGFSPQACYHAYACALTVPLRQGFGVSNLVKDRLSVTIG